MIHDGTDAAGIGALHLGRGHGLHCHPTVHAGGGRLALLDQESLTALIDLHIG
jgi:hypothetical protein